MNWIKETVLPRFKAFVNRRETEESLWEKCKSCNQMIFHKEYKKHLNVCNSCGFHGYISARDRLEYLFDQGTKETIELENISEDPLNFKDLKKYSDRIKDAQAKTNLKDAIITEFGLINNVPCIISCFDFAFMGGSMGRIVGNSIYQATEEAIARKCSYIVIPSSGGARMQEGIFSLMQLPKSIIAVNKLKKNSLPYIVLLTNPTTGGVTASFAMLGDIHIAEPGATIGFAGKRVIQETVKESLPNTFQTSEYLLDHGMVDVVANRHEHRKTIANILNIMMHKKK